MTADPFPANLNPPISTPHSTSSHAVLTARDLDATQAFYS
jgi:hypothetical protein